jgi:hypothetical protein
MNTVNKLTPLFALVLVGCPSRTKIADHAPAVRECETNENCEPAAPTCVHVNRKGEFSFKEEPLYSMCVAPCKSGACGEGQRCVERRMLKLVNDPSGGRFQQTGAPTTEHYCVPSTRYGAAQLGQACARDEDCAADAPFCASERCTRLCASAGAGGAGDCPSGYACKTFQRVGREAVQSFDFCLAP